MDTAVHIPLWIDLAAVAVGAAQGASFTVAEDDRNEFDILAGIVFAVAVGLGGGLVRDMLLNVRPAALQTDWYLVTAVLAGIAGMVTAHLIHRLRLFVDVLDAAALGLFVVVGVAKANDAGIGPSAQVLLGTITGVGGGVMRDLLAGRPVQLVQRTVPYALIAVLGSSGFVVVVLLGGSPLAGAIVAFVLVLALRVVAVMIGWRTPPPPAVKRRTRGEVIANAALPGSRKSVPAVAGRPVVQTRPARRRKPTLLTRRIRSPASVAAGATRG